MNTHPDDIHFKCLHCGGKIVISQEGAGMDLQCPHCPQLVRVPDNQFQAGETIAEKDVESKAVVKHSRTRLVDFREEVTLTNVARVLHQDLSSDYAVKLEPNHIKITKGDFAGCIFGLTETTFFDAENGSS
jgi:hypothetical protein